MIKEKDYLEAKKIIEAYKLQSQQTPVIRSVCSSCGFHKLVWWDSGHKWLCGKCGKE